MLSPEELTAAIEKLVTRDYEGIHQKANKMFKKELENLEIRTLWDSEKSDRYGEYFGVPMPRYSSFGTGHLTPQIVIFARPIIEHCRTPEAIEKKVHKVLLHEIGHHLGLNERELRERGIY